ncbi:MAG: hypothetical protein ACKVVP_18020 [Chloroflexota bacterium]
MATETDPKELLQKYVADLHSLLEHGRKAISRQADQLKGGSQTEAHMAVVEFKQTLERQEIAVEKRLKSLGGSASSPIQDGAGAIAGAVTGVYNAMRSEEASKSIRDDYTFFSHVAIASLMLYTSAKALRDEETAQLAQAIYKESAICVERIDVIMPKIVLDDLRDDGFTVLNVTDDSHRIIRDAWTGSTDANPALRSNSAEGNQQTSMSKGQSQSIH